MNDIDDIGYKVRQILNTGADDLNYRTTERLRKARHAAVQRYAAGRNGSAALTLGNTLGRLTSGAHHLRTVLALFALVVGIAGTYYWDEIETVKEYDEIDSALLADELPPAAYLDRGFQAWLEHGQISSAE